VVLPVHFTLRRFRLSKCVRLACRHDDDTATVERVPCTTTRPHAAAARQNIVDRDRVKGVELKAPSALDPTHGKGVEPH
jgi:hypothetical protein